MNARLTRPRPVTLFAQSLVVLLVLLVPQQEAAAQLKDNFEQDCRLCGGRMHAINNYRCRCPGCRTHGVQRGKPCNQCVRDQQANQRRAEQAAAERRAQQQRAAEERRLQRQLQEQQRRLEDQRRQAEYERQRAESEARFHQQQAEWDRQRREQDAYWEQQRRETEQRNQSIWKNLTEQATRSWNGFGRDPITGATTDSFGLGVDPIDPAKRAYDNIITPLNPSRWADGIQSLGDRSTAHITRSDSLESYARWATQWTQENLLGNSGTPVGPGVRRSGADLRASEEAYRQTMAAEAARQQRLAAERARAEQARREAERQRTNELIRILGPKRNGSDALQGSTPPTVFDLLNRHPRSVEDLLRRPAAPKAPAPPRPDLGRFDRPTKSALDRFDAPNPAEPVAPPTRKDASDLKRFDR